MSESKQDEHSLASKAELALKQAAKKAIQEARRTGTPVIVWEVGKVVEIPSSGFSVEQQEVKSTHEVKRS